MSTDLAKNGDPLADFKARVADKLAKDIGEMLPDDALATMVQQAVEKTFFEPRRVHERYGADTFEPGWFVAEVAKVSKPILERIVADFVAENKPILEKALTDFMDEKALYLIMAASIRADMSQDIHNMAMEIITTIRNN